MSKTIKEKAKEWGCSESTVKRYCESGIIPPAEKQGIRKQWLIPDDWEKPPMTRHGLCYLLDTIYQLNHGVLYDDIKWGFDEKEIKKGYMYLISSAFVSSFDVNKMKHSLKKATVTPRGEELIKRENAESKGKTSFTAHVTGKAKIGVAEIEAGIEVSKE